MSASLVGSEMCIRDRFSGSEWGLRMTDCARMTDCRWNRRSAGLLHYGSVSYTHLTLPTICSV
eukprot:7766761-Alexandrium_andersonii.AAC.1